MTEAQITELVFILKDVYPTKIKVSSDETMNLWYKSLQHYEYKTATDALHKLLSNKNEDRIAKNISPIAVFKDYYMAVSNNQEISKSNPYPAGTPYPPYVRKPIRKRLKSAEAHAFQIFIWGLRYGLSGNPPKGEVPTMSWSASEFARVKAKYTKAVQEALDERLDPLKHTLFSSIREQVYKEMGNEYLLIDPEEYEVSNSLG